MAKQFNTTAVRQISQAVAKSNSRRPPAEINSGGGVQVPAGDNGPFIVITTEPISPNTFGGFKFTSGARGSETQWGNEYQGFLFADEAAPDLPASTKCFCVWVPPSVSTESGWVITPILCPEE